MEDTDFIQIKGFNFIFSAKSFLMICVKFVLICVKSVSYLFLNALTRSSLVK